MSGVYTFSVNSYDAGIVGWQYNSPLNITNVLMTSTINEASGITWSGISGLTSSIAAVTGYVSGSSSSMRINNTITHIMSNNSVYLCTLFGMAQVSMVVYVSNLLSSPSLGCGWYDTTYTLSLSGTNVTC